MAGFSNLIVNYLPQSMTERELYSMFVTIGPVASCRVMKDVQTGYSYGYGFVNFTKPEDAVKAIEQLNGFEVFHKKLKVSYARPSSEAIKDTNLYITNLPMQYSECDLVNLFSPYGTIVQKNLLRDKITGMPRGVAFVRFDRREEAQLAIEKLDGIVPSGGSEQLHVRVADEHGKKKAAYYAGYHAGLQQSCAPTTNIRFVPILDCAPTPGRFENSRGGRGGTRGMSSGLMGRGGGVRGSRNNSNSFNANLVTYPITNRNGFGPIRQEKFQQRFNPI